MERLDLIGLDAVQSLDQDTVVRYYRDHVNPGIATFMRVLGFDRVRIVRAEGMYLYTADGRRLLDFSAGMNVLNHGHNHPRILAARRRFNEERRLEVCKALISPYEAVLARNLATILGGDLRYSFFCNSGAEANEGALKMATLYAGPSRDQVLFTDLGYHGKTFGTMSVSGPASRPYKELFKQLTGCIEVPYGDLEATRRVVEGRTRFRRCDIAAMILEPIKGDLVLTPPPGYLEGLVDLCRRHGIVVIFDEVFTGFGRTGKWFGFQHYGVIPDIVTYSKSLGGGKASIAGYTAREHIFQKTYGRLDRCTVHTSTFGGLGEECATAIEALNVIHDERLVEAAQVRGERLRERLVDLQRRHSRYVREARSIGLLGILELRKTSELLGAKELGRVTGLDEWLEGLLAAVVTANLLRDHQILIYTGGREDNLFINPALIVSDEEIDRVASALDQVLSGNLIRQGLTLLSNLLGRPQ